MVGAAPLVGDRRLAGRGATADWDIAGAGGAKYNNSVTLPAGYGSQQAQALLQRDFPQAAGDQDQIVVHLSAGTVTDPAVRARLDAMLARAELGHSGRAGAAVLVLLVLFGSVTAMLMPIMTVLVAIGAGISVNSLVTHVLENTATLAIALMIALAWVSTTRYSSYPVSAACSPRAASRMRPPPGRSTRPGGQCCWPGPSWSSRCS